MTIEKRIKLKNNIYYIVIEVEYKINRHNITELCLKNYNDDYYDGGDFSILIDRIEKSYEYEKASEYDSEIGLMGDVLYLYDRIPFLSGIKDVYINKDDNLPYSVGYISKNEIDKYIESHNVTMNNNTNFKLFDERTWKI